MPLPRRLILAGVLMAAPAVAQETLRLEVRPPDYRFQFLPRFKAPGQRSLALALGGGAAKGIAHAGVLQRLDEEGLPPDSIAGTSMGAYMGSMYAVGYSGYSMQRLLERMNMGAVLLDRQRRSVGETLWEQENRTATLFSVEIGPKEGLTFQPGASSGLELKHALQMLLSRGLYYGGADFDHLRVPFRAVSTDLQSGIADAPGAGSIVDAVRASMSIPGMFRPVMLNGHQHVDGILVENLPVHQAQAMNPMGLVVAVEAGSQLEAVRASSVFGVLVRALEVSIEERTRLSRQAADVLLRPDTSKAGYLDFFNQVPAVVAMGREAFDQHREDIERGLYGPDGETPMPGGPVNIDAPPELLGPIQSLVRDLLPPAGQPRLKRNYYRLLRRINAAGFAKDAAIHFSGGPPALKVEAQPRIQGVDLEAPAEWKDALASVLADGDIKPGQAYNPTTLGQALDRLLLVATLRYRPMLSFEGTAFDAATGRLKVVVREPDIEAVQVAPGILPKGDTSYLQRLLTPLAGGPMDARRIFEQVSLGEARLDLEEVAIGARMGPAGAVLMMTPVPKERVIVDAILAYESTWGIHAGLSAHSGNLFGTGASLDFQASTDRLKDGIDLEASRSFHWAPRSGLRVFASQFEQRFIPESLEAPGLLAPLADEFRDRSLRERGLGFGYFQRFAERDQGLVRLDFSRRWSALSPVGDGPSTPSFDLAQLSVEWDSFDRYTFPAEGALLRLMGGEGRLREDAPSGENRLHFAYLRGRKLVPALDGVSLDLDSEIGLGWRLPMSRWYSLGGPQFLLGTPSAGFLTPNFAVLRIGLPVRLANFFGLHAQLEPRLDFGYLGGEDPTRLREGTRVKGAGLLLRTEVGRFYVELAVGRSAIAPEGSGFSGRGTHLNLLVGARPFDLWSRR